MELGKDLFGPVYHVNTFNQKKRGPFSKISGTTPISLDASTDSPLAPILVLDGKILPRTGPAGTLTPGSFKEQLGIDSDDIERINVLKGKAAFEKYGEIAANGVIEIELKSTLDTTLSPILVINGKVSPRPAPSGNLTPEVFKEQIGIDSEDIESINVLKGKAALEKYGEKATNGVIEIKTKSTLNPSQSPLLVINGKISPRPAPSGNFTPEVFKEQLGIDSEDIESINVLKGKAALQKYGEKATNGVIEIKTKSTLNTPQLPLVVLDGKIVQPKASFEKEGRFFILNVNKFAEEFNVEIEEGRTLGKEEAINKYGRSDKTKVLELWTKEGLNNRKESNQPLLVIDGVELFNHSLNKEASNNVDLPPEDIKSINVLKGEAAEKKYGQKGINGVVEITTKFPKIVRLNISDFVFPNGEAMATLKHSQKYDDVLLLKDWKEYDLAINGSLPQYINGSRPNKSIDALPSHKHKLYEELSSHQIHSIYNRKLKTHHGEKWIRYIYTNQAPKILWRPSATGGGQNLFPNKQLFFLNMPNVNTQKISAEVEEKMSSSGTTYSVAHILNEEGEEIARDSHRFYDWNYNSHETKTRILSRKAAIEEFGTSGVTGLLVVELGKESEKNEADTPIAAEQDISELAPFSKPPKNFPVVALGVSPNPADQRLDIVFLLEKKKDVRLSIYDRTGREVAVVENGVLEKGKYSLEWDRKELAAGVYFVVAQIAGQAMSTPIILE